MSLQLSGRRRAVGNRGTTKANNNNSNSKSDSLGAINSNKSCNHGCDCSSSKYRHNKGIHLSTLYKRVLPFAIFLYGAMALLRFRSLPLPLPLIKSIHSSTSKDVIGNCELRTYPKRRYYGLDKKPLPDFLDTEYIYGKLPLLVNPTEVRQNSASAAKLCVDQSEWYDPKKTLNDSKTTTSAETASLPALPFADGTNPSILKLIDNPRIDPSIRKFLETKIVGRNGERPYYLATICMTDSQCSWNDSPQEIAQFHLSKDRNPSAVRTVLLAMSKNFETLMEATIHTRIDAQFGRVKPNNQMKTFKLDDARLFTHKGQIWVSYREGKHFGYDKQVLNQLHFDFTDSSSSGGNTADTKGLRTKAREDKNTANKELTVTLLASDTETLCCGRNMALIDNVHTDELQALTWVDPVTVVDVDVSKTDRAVQQSRRRLKQESKKNSHFHGTNGFMVHLPKTGEYLGIGHFHRPPGRDKNDYARFGHHYTHAFFTITDQPPFRLNRLSAELVLSSHSYPEDAEIIQFWSGLELSADDNGKDVLALAYGINDCEGAAIHLDLAFVDGLLKEVPEGKEVVDFMMPLKQ